MKVSVIGTGYVGLVSGVCLAEKGHQITCVDIDPIKVNKINQGIAPIYEKGLDELLRKNINTNLWATTDLTQAVLETDVSLIAVGTPFDGDAIDLKYIREVSRQIGTVLREKAGYHLVIVKSTVVPGTTDQVVLPILEEASGKKAGVDFGVGMNPEFLREGEAVDDFMNPDRIVLGGIDETAIALMSALYAPFPDTDKLLTNPRTAEMIKYTANSLLATLISFSNEIGNLCSAIGQVDVVEVMHGVHLDKRFSPILEDGQRVKPAMTTYLEAGCGFGGSCFPKDVKALIAHARSLGVKADLLEQVIMVNNSQPYQMLQLLNQAFTNLEGVRVAVLGVAFKPGTDDIRESPALPIIEQLLAAGASVRAFDPIARHEAEKLFGQSPNLQFPDTLEAAVAHADAILLVTRWQEFKNLPQLLQQLGSTALVVDGRRMLNKRELPRYAGIGLSTVLA